MNELGFVILHYKTIYDTIKCVDSILKNVPDSPIVVVDNGSGDGTGYKLKNQYSKNERVEIVQSPKNLGFAQGNNLGIRSIRKKYECKFVAVMNNDTMVIQNDFADVIYHEYKESSFAILGPQIIDKNNNINSNPVEHIVGSRKDAAILIFKRIVKLLIYTLYLNKIVKINNAGENNKTDGTYDNSKRYENIKLHGACLIFSERFFDCYKGFNPNTFLYFEEDVLYHEAKKRALQTVYNPALKIIHSEDSSTNAMYKNKTRKKNIFVLKNEIKSLIYLIKLLKNSGNTYT